MKVEKLMKNNELISIIIPVYNVEKYLMNCLNSVMNQTYKNIEIILIDDGSTDKSGEICEQYAKLDNRVIVIHKENGGLSDARNCGISKARGNYITFVDSDDKVTNDYIEYLYYLILKYNTKISICNYSVISSSKSIPFYKSKKQIEMKMNKVDALREMLRENLFSVSSCAKLYCKELFDTVRFPIGKLCEDNGTTYKLIEECEYVSFGSKSIYYYYKRKNSIMNSSFNEKKLDLIELVDQMKIELVDKYPELYNEILNRQILARFSVLRQMLMDNYDNEKTDEIIRFIKQNKKFILNNNEVTNKREKFALITLLLGKKVFKYSWIIYSKIKY